MAAPKTPTSKPLKRQTTTKTSKPRKVSASSKNSTVGKAKTPRASSSARVSEKTPSSQPGPDRKDLKSKKRSTDTRAGRKPSTGTRLVRKEAGKKKKTEHPAPQPSELQPRADDRAYRQPLRTKNPEVPAPVEVQTIKGEKVEVVANPGKVDPTELKPGRRDALRKDRLRADGKADVADAPVKVYEGGQHETEKVKLS